jgi:hypothetical protein
VEESNEPNGSDDKKKASKQKMQEDYSKYSLRMNIFYRKICHVTTNSKNCHLMKPQSQGEVG